jgi:agmatine deiminase
MGADEGVIPDWETNHLFLSDRLAADEPALFDGLCSALAGVPLGIISGTNDIWCRDYMPVQVEDAAFCQFIYAPDYLRGHEHLITPPCRLPFMHDYRREAVVLDGGNVVASRTKVILTDKTYMENPSFERPRLRQRLEAAFQAECVIIPKEPYDVIGHADGVARFISDDRVLVNDYSTVDPGHGARLRRVLERAGLDVETLPLFQDDATGQGRFKSAVGVYVNFLRVAEVVILPAYGRPEDRVALDKMRAVLPETTVAQLPCRSLAEKGGVLNCISWAVKMSGRGRRNGPVKVEGNYHGESRA